MVVASPDARASHRPVRVVVPNKKSDVNEIKKGYIIERLGHGIGRSRLGA